MHILDMDAAETARRIREGTLSASDAVEGYICHLNQIHPVINAMVEDRFDLARQEAKWADEQIRSGIAKGRLHGVPISVKECFHVKGMKTTSGVSQRKDDVAQEDADVVARLRQEGAIILGKTNTPAFCFCQETDNLLYGRTNNPWNPARTAGGSSGGEGALIAAGGAAVGIGADIGGSIRFPSHFNGIVGFKSGSGQVSDHGNYPPVVIPEQHRMLGIGAMAKSVRDVRLIHEIIANTVPAKKQLSSFIMVIPEKQPQIPLGKAAETHLNTLRQSMAAAYTVETGMPPFFKEAALIWQEIMSIDGGQELMNMLSYKHPVRLFKDLVQSKWFNTSEVHPYLSWALIGARLFRPSQNRMREIQLHLQRGDQALNEFFEQRIAILPVYHSAAPVHGRLYKEIFSVRKTYLKYMPYVAYANTWGLPALTIPVGEDEEGLPVGVQLISKNGNEEALFQLGEWIEQHFRGYRRCTLHDRSDKPMPADIQHRGGGLG
ncbi:amidase [Marinicrinis lubricantis]|uniref:Amidase n=1 Tax=Marinicrinis lubricantis TaxID=2086470 RepID=A0ABW1IQ85_9BACL